jgi:hypothetical protein
MPRLVLGNWAVVLGQTLDERGVSSGGHDLPSSCEEVALAATDDTILIHESRDVARTRFGKLNASFAYSHVARNAENDVNLAKCTVAPGCDLDLERNRHSFQG